MKEITGHTKLTGLLGSPVAHSISPQMHNEAFRQLDLDYVYLAFDVKPNDLRTAVDGLKILNVRGFNLTMPHKNLILEYIDHISPAAKISGSVNTVVNDNGILTGHTTDGIGFLRAVEQSGHSIISKKMTLLGAGGASSSVLVQAALDGVKEIEVFNRRSATFDKAQKLIDTLNQETDCKISLYDYEDETILKKNLESSDILVNGTSVGMAPNEDGCIIKHQEWLRPELFVADVIYNPRETKLLRMARENGCDTMNGLYMLLYQGAAAFEIWTGKEMPVEIVREKYFEK